jgi:hypothetical protein
MTPPKSELSDASYLSKSVPEGEFLAPARVTQLNRKHSDLSNRSEPDSLLELYKSQARNRSVPTGIENGVKRKISNGFASGTLSPEEVEDNWIHRDKLAQIESRELEEAGFRVPSKSRSASRSHSNSLEREDEPFENEDVLDEDIYSQQNEKRRRMVSPIPGEDEDNNFDWELRTPEEVAAEQREMLVPAIKPPPRQRGSRLPVKKLNGLPAGSVERDSPAARSRTASGTASMSGIPTPRPRTGSFGSQYLLENDENMRPQTPMRSSVNSSEKDSPSKTSKVPKGAPTSGARKTSAARNATTIKSRQSSAKGDSPPKRPGTSSGLTRPSTSHRPEGEAPWIASMFQPDPRLPPEKQMLPTHAKRLAQEQWEREGKTGTVYDREFRLLNANAFPEPKSPTKDTSPENGDREKTTVLTARWPLTQDPPLGSPRSIASSNRPGTSGTEHGGYRTMPMIHNPPTQTLQPVSSPKPTMQPMRVQEPPEPAEKEKQGLCGCCVVM